MIIESAPLIIRNYEYRSRPKWSMSDCSKSLGEKGVACANVGVRMIVITLTQIRNSEFRIYEGD